MALPWTIGGLLAAAAGIVADTKAVDIDFDGGTEYMRSASANIGIGDDWTIQLTFKLTEDSSSTDAILEVGPTSSNDNIRFDVLSSSNRFKVTLFNSAGGSPALKNISYDYMPAFGNWQTWVVTFDGSTGDVLKAYLNGVVKTASLTSQDNAGAQANSSRKICFGARTNGTNGSAGVRIHSCAMWSSVLGATEPLATYNSGAVGEFDLEADSGNYTSSSSLVHWWRVGMDSGDIGADEITSGAIDMMGEQSNITSADIVSDAPS
jgi:hypothetical protein